ncbi:putative acetyltransferase 3 [Desulfosarcina variabilis str. Montpellier]|uniref:acyltransferase family protein n=1 Tax=Desulfosarcina variabilis TaxID=2300 RepID=UPI003AFA1EA4
MNNFKFIQHNRDHFLGFSIILIVFYHYKIIFWGEIGVDLFVFLSGYGLAWGYSQKKVRLVNFWLKRAKRLFPAYWTILLAYVFYSVLCTDRTYSLTQVLLNMSCLQMYVVGFKSIIPHVWYLSLIVTMYFFFPMFLNQIRKKRLLPLMLFIYTLMAIEYVTVNLFPIAMFRIPTFIAGVWIGYASISNRELLISNRIEKMASSLIVFVLMTIFVIAALNLPVHLLWNPGRYWTIIALFSPLLSISLLVACQPLTLQFESIFSAIGRCSYEIFLSHQLIYDLLQKKMMTIIDVAWCQNFIPFLIAFIVFCFSHFFHICITKFVKMSLLSNGMVLNQK